MSVWLLYKYVDYEGVVDHSIEVYASQQKAMQERDNRNYLLRRDWDGDANWKVKKQELIQ